LGEEPRNKGRIPPNETFQTIREDLNPTQFLEKPQEPIMGLKPNLGMDHPFG